MVRDLVYQQLQYQRSDQVELRDKAIVETKCPNCKGLISTFKSSVSSPDVTLTASDHNLSTESKPLATHHFAISRDLTTSGLEQSEFRVYGQYH